MKILDCCLPTPEANLACDEALLESAEKNQSGEAIRFWSCPEPFAVLGYSNKAEEDLNLSACRKHAIPVLRRISGGGTVLQGPGCLNYALILKHEQNESLRSITLTNHHVMEKNRKAITSLTGGDIAIRGITDLTIGDLKFSGNAQRRKRRFLLFHGTFLLNFDIESIKNYLNTPARQPDYRYNREHLDFLTNLNIEADRVTHALIEAWGASGVANIDLSESIKNLVECRYSRQEWNLKF